MLACQPHTLARPPLSHRSYVLVALLQTDLEVAVAPVAGEVVGQPRRGIAAHGGAGRVCRVEVGKPRVVGAEEAVEELVPLLAGGEGRDAVDDVARLRAVGVEQQGGVRRLGGEGGQLDDLDGPAARVGVPGEGGGEPLGEAADRAAGDGGVRAEPEGAGEGDVDLLEAPVADAADGLGQGGGEGRVEGLGVLLEPAQRAGHHELVEGGDLLLLLGAVRWR